MPATIELHIQRHPDERITAELRAYQRGVTVLASSVPITISAEALRALSYSPDVYGTTLAAMVFAGDLRAAWERARGYAEGAGRGVVSTRTQRKQTVHIP
jgi:hypothetical protein